MCQARSGRTVMGMNTTQQLAVREQDDAAVYRTVIEDTPNSARPYRLEPAPAPIHRPSRGQRFLRQMLEAIFQAGQPAATPQAPLILPNGAATWTPYATHTGRRSTAPDQGPH